MPEPVISVSGLRKSYGSFQAVRGIDFEVAPGEVFGLLGPNGAGKTTLISAVCNLLRITSGEALVFGQPAHSHIAASSRACACCFALSLLGLMRMESKNLDESIAMTDFDYAMPEASSLDIANTSVRMCH